MFDKIIDTSSLPRFLWNTVYMGKDSWAEMCGDPAVPLFWRGELGPPIKQNVAWAEAYLRSKWHLDTSSSLLLFGLVYCGQTVAHLSYCWALVTGFHSGKQPVTDLGKKNFLCIKRSSLFLTLFNNVQLIWFHLSIIVFEQELSSSWDGRPSGHNRHGPKSGGCCDPFRGSSIYMWRGADGKWDTYLRTKWHGICHLDPSSRLATIDMGWKVGIC